MNVTFISQITAGDGTATRCTLTSSGPVRSCFRHHAEKGAARFPTLQQRLCTSGGREKVCRGKSMDFNDKLEQAIWSKGKTKKLQILYHIGAI